MRHLIWFAFLIPIFLLFICANKTPAERAEDEETQHKIRTVIEQGGTNFNADTGSKHFVVIKSDVKSDSSSLVIRCHNAGKEKRDSPVELVIRDPHGGKLGVRHHS